MCSRQAASYSRAVVAADAVGLSRTREYDVTVCMATVLQSARLSCCTALCEWLQYCSQHDCLAVLRCVSGYSTAVSTTVLLYFTVCVAKVLRSARLSYCTALCAWLQYCGQHDCLTVLHCVRGYRTAVSTTVLLYCKQEVDLSVSTLYGT
jgi:hypothetical protein